MINLFQKFLYRINNWINEGSRWVIESIDAEYVNISVLSPLSGSIYIKLPCRLKNSMKFLINIKNSDNKCFLWCHIRHSNLLKIHPERISKADKNMANDLDYEGIKFPVSKKDFRKIEKKTIAVLMFCYETNLVYPVHLSDEPFKNCKELLMITDENNPASKITS